METIIPKTITSAMVTSSVVEDDAATYNPATNYAADALVVYEHRVYKSLQAANTGHTPGIAASLTWWVDQGPTNMWAMFDGRVDTKTSKADVIEVTLTPGIVKGLAVLNVQALEVEVEMVNGLDVVYGPKTFSMVDTSQILDYYDYFFAETVLRTELAITDLPPYNAGEITVTLNNPGATASCGMVSLGRLLDSGQDLRGVKISITDYSRAVFDELGELEVTRRGYAKNLNVTMLLPNGSIDKVAKGLSSVANLPCVHIVGYGRRDSYIVYGLVSFDIDVAEANYSYCSAEVKGML